MGQVSVDEVRKYVEKNIGTFHKKRLDSIAKLRLEKIISHKNPYLFKAKNILTAEGIVKTLLDSHLSSQEETMFGDFLEGLAVFICGKVYGGRKSPAEGIDLEVEKDGVIYLVVIKSGPNWGNSSQVRKMREDFIRGIKILRSNAPRRNVQSINGCCYGRVSVDRGEYFKISGQKFWEFISGDPDLYLTIVKPLDHKAKEKNEAFYKAYAELINKFTIEFTGQFCSKSGKIDWDAIVKLNSSVSKRGGKILINQTNGKK
jgi:hypothetical protein